MVKISVFSAQAEAAAPPLRHVTPRQAAAMVATGAARWLTAKSGLQMLVLDRLAERSNPGITAGDMFAFACGKTAAVARVEAWA